MARKSEVRDKIMLGFKASIASILASPNMRKNIKLNIYNIYKNLSKILSYIQEYCLGKIPYQQDY